MATARSRRTDSTGRTEDGTDRTTDWRKGVHEDEVNDNSHQTTTRSSVHNPLSVNSPSRFASVRSRVCVTRREQWSCGLPASVPLVFPRTTTRNALGTDSTHNRTMQAYAHRVCSPLTRCSCACAACASRARVTMTMGWGRTQRDSWQLRRRLTRTDTRTGGERTEINHPSFICDCLLHLHRSSLPCSCTPWSARRFFVRRVLQLAATAAVARSPPARHSSAHLSSPHHHRTTTRHCSAQLKQYKQFGSEQLHCPHQLTPQSSCRPT